MGGGAMHADLPKIQFKTSSSSAVSSLSSSFPSSSLNFPAASVNTTTPCFKLHCCTHSSCYCTTSTGTCKEVEALHGKKDKRNFGSFNEAVFGRVPSKSEVESAITSLQNVMQGSSSSVTQFNQLQQMLDCYDLRTIFSHGFGRVCEAFRLLQTEPSIKRMVVSLSSDKAIWDAVMNNETVRKLRESSISAENPALSIRSCEEEEPVLITSMFRWIMDVTKAKVGELIQIFQSLMDEIFQPPERENSAREPTDKLDDKIKSSLLLSVVILLIVVVARAYGG